MGQFFSKALRAAGVEVQVDKDNSHHTGTVMVGGVGWGIGLAQWEVQVLVDHRAHQSSQSVYAYHTCRFSLLLTPSAPSCRSSLAALSS
jgi:hypothetical protein